MMLPPSRMTGAMACTPKKTPRVLTAKWASYSAGVTVADGAMVITAALAT